jgi:hypothetical protein
MWPSASLCSTPDGFVWNVVENIAEGGFVDVLLLTILPYPPLFSTVHLNEIFIIDTKYLFI